MPDATPAVSGGPEASAPPLTGARAKLPASAGSRCSACSSRSSPGGSSRPTTTPWNCRARSAAWRRYRRMRSGVQLSLWSLVRRLGWAKLIVGQAARCTLVAVVVVTVPRSERLVPQVLFWVALVPTRLTVWSERAAIRA
ncbi:hypothetical protein ACFV60_08080 [Streptomyces virginiae]|uniref:hypothetical protein n=1 Tax=Streptomyces virginiae TaxID=1961 RepID=UPI003663798B